MRYVKFSSEDGGDDLKCTGFLVRENDVTLVLSLGDYRAISSGILKSELRYCDNILLGEILGKSATYE